MPKLTNIKGAEVLPHKKKLPKHHAYSCKVTIDNECTCDECHKIHIYNQCVQQLDKIGVVGRLDRDKLQDWISLKLGQMLVDDSPDKSGFRKSDGLVDAIIANQSSLIELELVVEKE